MRFLPLSKRKKELFEKISKSTKMDFFFFASILRTIRKDFLIVLPIFTLVGFIYAFQEPNLYNAESKLILLPQNNTNGVDFGNLSSLKGFIGMNISSNNEEFLTTELLDAIANSAPLVNEVIFEPINFGNCDAKISYYDYLILSRNRSRWEVFFSNLTGNLEKIKVERGSSMPFVNSLDLSVGDYRLFKEFSDRVTIKEDNGIITMFLLLEDPVAAKELLKIIQSKLYEFAAEIQMKEKKVKYNFIKSVYYRKKEVLDSLKSEIRNHSEGNTLLSEELDIARDLALTARKLYESSKLSLEQSRPVFHVVNPPQYPDRKFSPSRKAITIFTFFVGIMFVLMLFVVRYFMFRVQQDED